MGAEWLIAPSFEDVVKKDVKIFVGALGLMRRVFIVLLFLISYCCKRTEIGKV